MKLVIHFTCLLIHVGLSPLCGDEVDFNRDVKPILSSRCFLCHGPDESSRQADLRLDSFAAATDYAIVPGDAKASEFLDRIIDADDASRMPPAEHGPALTIAEQTILRRWIENGAKFDVHWSYQKPRRSRLEYIADPRNKNDIDGYVLHSLKQHQLGPSPAANRYSIIRRLALDLTGLPPTIDEAESLFKDGSERAYEMMVDYFLNQKAFGERWAAVWLDQARYADSMGYAEDRNREIWAYRDYVIRAINNNMPYDQFTIEQLAGDLLTNPTEDQLVATAFHRNTLTNTEGGTIDEEFRSAAVIDRTNTTAAVWMGTTIACAQCHTHKYDPITQDEYFQFYAFFNSTADDDQPNDSPKLKIYSDKQKRQIEEINAEITMLESKTADWSNRSMEQQLGEMSKQRMNWLSENSELANNLVNGSIVRIELPRTNAFLSLAEVQVFAAERNVALEGNADQSSTAYDGPADRAIDGNVDGNLTKNKSVTHSSRESSPWWEVRLDDSYDINRIVIWNRGEGLHSRLDGFEVSILNVKRETIWKAGRAKAKPSADEFTVQRFPDDVFDALSARPRTAQQQSLLEIHSLEKFAPTTNWTERVASLRRERDSILPYTTVPILKELKEQRETYVHIRGSYLSPGNQVWRGTPDAFHPLKSGTKDRLQLAKWIVHPDNPLTARVAVNRFWQQLFGIGIVSTSEEFGSQGELPSHPELLDYLACEFVDSDWNVKQLIKQMVMSATYRQSSKATAEKFANDPNNRWLSRGPRFRLTAEMVRDQALLSSGLLSPKMFGPPVQPPQPKTGLKIAFRSETADWEDSLGEDRYRRAIYTRWRRTSPYPSMTTFDISNREVCELRRLRTNTPLQALVTLNDPVYVEAAQALARRVYEETKSPEQIARKAFRHALIRHPSEQEAQLLIELYNESVSHFETNKQAAAMLAIDPLNPVDKNVDLVKLAAWTTVANSILNLDEIFMKR